MITTSQKTLILDTNARYYGILPAKLMENSGRGIARTIERKYGIGKEIGIFCGLGNNGGDGFVAARYLSKKNNVKVFLMGEPSAIKTKEAKDNWNKLTCKKLVVKNAAEITTDFDIVLEAIFGTGIKGKVKEPQSSIIKKLTRAKAVKVAVDIPAPSFKPDLTVSMHFPKVKGSEIIDIGIPKKIEKLVGPGEVKALYKPPENSHKGQNGKLLIIAGSHKYHGASNLPLKVASRLVDLVYFSSVPENNKLVEKMKLNLCEFITVERGEIGDYAEKADTILIGPGMGTTKETKKLTEDLLKRYNKKFVLDADALKTINPKYLGENCILTPHKGEFKELFGIRATEKNVVAMAKKYNCIIVLKGKKDIICGKDECKWNLAGNQGMTKGGTGDVLAGLIAALACKNDLFLATCAGAFINGLAGDRLREKVSFYYNASDLVNEIPKTIADLEMR